MTLGASQTGAWRACATRGTLNARLIERDAGRRQSDEVTGDTQRLRHELTGGNDPIDKPEPQSLVGLDVPARHQQFLRHRSRHEVGPYELAHGGSGQPVFDVGLGDVRSLGDHHDVTEGQQGGPETNSRAVDRGDNGNT